MVLERVAEVGGRGAGGFLGGLANNPGVIIIAVVAVALFIFRDRITGAFGQLGEAIGNIGNIEFPDITFPDFPEFPDITFPDFPEFPELPELPDFCQLFGLGCPDDGGDSGGLPLPPDVEDTGLLTPEERAECECGTNIIQDIQGDVSETCITPCAQDEPPVCGDPDFIGPCQPDEEPIGGTGPPEEEPEEDFPCPEGFVCEGPTFEGGFIFERDDCFSTLNELINKYDITASQAADLRAAACTANETEEPFDIPPGGPGGSSGPGAGPMNGNGDATPESEAQRAACTSCELFGLNCPICMGEVNFG